jgi:hypothetical protein
MAVKTFELASAGASVVVQEGVKPLAFSCALLPFPAGWSSIRVERETLVSLLAGALGARDLEFESGEFNRVFRVSSPDARFANALIDVQMMGWLMSLPSPWGFEASDGMLLGYTGLRQPWKGRGSAVDRGGVPGTRSRGRLLAVPAGATQGG